MKWSIKHHNLCPHHVYQLEIILLFASGFFLFVPYYYLINDVYQLDMNEWQWYFFLPWIAFFTAYSLYQRSKTLAVERVSPLKRPFLHWLLFGTSLFVFHLQPTNLEQLLALDINFGVFSLFMADAYWDFRKNR